MSLALSTHNRPQIAARSTARKATRAIVQLRPVPGRGAGQRGEGVCACGGGCPRCEARAAAQPKLAATQPGGSYELEADRIAAIVMCEPVPPARTGEGVGVGASGLPLEREGASGGGATVADAVPPIVDDVLRSLDRPLDLTTRAFMEPRFGQDFSRVRVHADGRAAESARALNALAYTVGRDMVFGAGQYAPGTSQGRQLLAHELAHVVQQGNSARGFLQRKDDEKAAEATGDPCGGKSQADTYKPSEKDSMGKDVEVELNDKLFGNTAKLAAFFQFNGCRVKDTWRFSLGMLGVPIASKVQPEGHRVNVNSATDSVVKEESYLKILSDLSPTKSVKIKVSCGGNKFIDKVSSYSARDEYWNRQLVIDHEAFHRKDWDAMYRTELVKAEKEVWAHSLAASEASDVKAAVSKEAKNLEKYMIDAYQRACKAYAPAQESRAYDDGAPRYQKLVDEIQARAKKEKWK